MLILIPKRRPTDLTWIEENSYNWELDSNEPNWEKIAKYWEEKDEQKEEKIDQKLKEPKETVENNQKTDN
jgi:hypothetical protein